MEHLSLETFTLEMTGPWGPKSLTKSAYTRRFIMRYFSFLLADNIANCEWAGE